MRSEPAQTMKDCDRGDWIQTFSGRAFFPMDPRAEDIDILDISHALAHLCRFGGHARRFYSVGEHCVLLSRQVSAENALWALLHDASEAYLLDLPRPIKRTLPDYRAAEARIMAIIAAKFGLAEEEPEEVRRADHRILTDEARQAMTAPPMPWATETEPFGVTLKFWSPKMAKRKFIERYLMLTAPRQKGARA